MQLQNCARDNDVRPSRSRQTLMDVWVINDGPGMSTAAPGSDQRLLTCPNTSTAAAPAAADWGERPLPRKSVALSFRQQMAERNAEMHQKYKRTVSPQISLVISLKTLKKFLKIL